MGIEGLAAELWHWLPAEGLRFLERGGSVLPFIGLLSGLLWLLIAERYWFLLVTHRRHLRRLPMDADDPCARSQARPCRWIRAARVSRTSVALERRLGLIDALTQALPLLGLLGTVEGMIEVFHVLALHGSGNVRAMAGGISAALITTLAGLVTALSGLYFGSDLRERVGREVQRVRERWA